MAAPIIVVTKLMAKLHKSDALIQRYEKDIMKVAEKYHKIVKDRTPDKTGETKKSWRRDVNMDKAGVSWRLTPVGTEENVRRLEFGTRPHVILPTDPAGVLAFHWDKIGKDMFLKRVYHPGTKPLGFVRQTQDEATDECQRLTHEMRAELKRIWATT